MGVEMFPHERLNHIKGVVTTEVVFSKSDEKVLEWLKL